MRKQAEPETTPTPATPTGSNDLATEARDLSELIGERLASAEADGIVEAIEIKGSKSSGRGSASAANGGAATGRSEEPPTPPLDLSLLADVFWDDIADRRGWTEAGMPVEPTMKQRWGEALASILDQALARLDPEQRAQVVTAGIFLGVTGIIAYPRERVMRKMRKAQKASEEA